MNLAEDDVSDDDASDAGSDITVNQRKEQAKFVDIGKTVQMQYTAGTARIIEWAHIVNANIDAGKPMVAAMAEVGIDIAGGQPRPLEPDAVRASDVVVTMGCGDACPAYPGIRYEDWNLPDPAGLPIDRVRPIRNAIRARVELLLAGLASRESP